jgi:hypothetical protein
MQKELLRFYPWNGWSDFVSFRAENPKIIQGEPYKTVIKIKHFQTGCFIFSYFYGMVSQKLTDLQLELLRVYSFRPNEEDLLAIKQMFAKYFS